MCHEIADFRLIEIAAEAAAEIGRGFRLSEDRRGASAVTAHQPSGMRIGEERIARLQLGDFGLIAANREVAAWEGALGCPRRALEADDLADLFQRMFAQPAIGGELAAKDIEQRRLPLMPSTFST